MKYTGVKIGPKIKDFLDSKGIEVRELGEILGISKQAAYDLLKKEDVNTKHLKVLCDKFKMPINHFFDAESGQVQEPSGEEGYLPKEVYQDLKKQLIQKDNQIEFLQNQINSCPNQKTGTCE